MTSLTPRTPTGQDHPLALVLGLSASHRCRHMAEAPAVKTCHIGRGASILLLLTDMSSFAPDSHGAADGGTHRLSACFFGWCVSFFQGDSLALNSAFKLKLTTGSVAFSSRACFSPAQIQLSSHPQPPRSRDMVNGVYGSDIFSVAILVNAGTPF